ncbi:MAG: crossover junction endodeoxyribonuclease RuvC [Candidatus Babeliaceae bacterium]
MIVLGIDPGFSITGFGVMKRESGKVVLLEYGYICLERKDGLPRRLTQFYQFFSDKIQQFQVTHLGLETPFLGKNAQNFLKLGYLRGALYLLCDRYQLIISEFSPREVKMKVAGSGAADKEQVARCMMRFFPALHSLEKLDVTDALAVTLCCIWAQSSPLHKFSL